MTAAPRVAVVKSAGRADVFAVAIRDAGCVPVLVSPFRAEEVEGSRSVLADALRDGPGWVAVTSPHAAALLEVHARAGLLGGLQVAAVGQGTGSALHAVGVLPSIVGDGGGVALGRRMLASGLAAGERVVHPCAEEVRTEMHVLLREAGVEVVPVPIYRMRPDPVGARAAGGTFAAAVITSPRLAARALELFAERPPAVAIGRTTAAALRDLGWSPAAVAAGPVPEAVVAALRAVL